MPSPLAPGTAITPRTLTGVHGDPIPLPDPHRTVHLQFRRFAGCPICNLHLRSFTLRRDDITAAGIRPIAVFHSPADQLLPHAESIGADLVPDPGRRLYRAFAVETSPRALLSPRAWPGIARAVAATLRPGPRGLRQPPPPLRVPGGRFGLPADFLISPDGTLLAREYGTHADDQWSVDELLTLARR
ncbi:peroxiredoxin-like family protein [Nocardiopsis potens]|uniref:peroxiredoxin-like family protein n=1 Tax=Nocardiopsis potens TaxID=1246458 RepID=UPI00034C8CF1|nr:peroxiredoxin-like family protein [Nocardiopsis potens]